MSWKSPNTITGDAATGDRYFKRPDIEAKFWEEVEKGNHILFTAPRRVGKTSVMKYLVENPPDNYVCFYEDIEGVKSKKEFYKALYTIILKCADSSEKAKAFLKKWFAKCGIAELSKSGIKFKDAEIDYENSLHDLIPALAEANVHTVIFLDEFAEVIYNLPAEDAKQILHTLRAIRSNEDFRHFTIVFAGSIGLQFVVKGIDRPKIINDLHPVDIGPLSKAEAIQLVEKATEQATIKLSSELTDFLLETVSHLLPYYIQIMLDEIDLLARRMQQEEITTGMVTEAFNNVLKKNNTLSDWLERLKSYQHKNFSFINHLLKHAAHKDKISVQEIYNIALDEKYNRADDYMEFVTQLVNDGYLVEYSPLNYRFVSPLLKKFWLNQYPVYNG